MKQQVDNDNIHGKQMWCGISECMKSLIIAEATKCLYSLGWYCLRCWNEMYAFIS